MGHTASRYLSAWLLASLVVLVGGVGSAVLWHQQSAAMGRMGQERFEGESQAFAAALQRRVESETDLLNGLRGLLTLNPQLRRRDFERVASDMDLAHQHPEIKNITFTRYVPGAERAAFEQRTLADAHLDGRLPAGPAIHPAQQLPDYFVVDYVWPVDGNESLRGLEIHSQPGNAEAFLRMRDSRSLVASAPFLFNLPGEVGSHAGLAMRMPVFASDDTGQSHFLGAVGLSLRVYDLVQTLRAEGLGAHLALQVDDVGSQQAPTPAYALLPAEKTSPDYAAMHDQHQVHIGGRVWHVRSQPSASMLSSWERRQPRMVTAGALVTTMLLALLVFVLALRRSQALRQVGVAGEALQESEERFRAAFNQAAVGMSQTDSFTGRLVRVNQRLCSILGYSEQELLQMYVGDFSHPDDQGKDQALVARMLSGAIHEFELEKRYRRKDGSEVWVDLAVAAMRVSGDVHYHIAVIQDITERKQAQQALLASEQRLLGILNHMPVGVCQIRGNEFLFRNRAHYQLCGFDAQDAPDVETWWRLVQPDEAQRSATRTPWQQACAAARQQGDGSTIRPIECGIINKAGMHCSIELSGVVLGDGYIAIMADQTQRKEAESEIRYLVDNDLLTGLPNRRWLLDHLQRTLLEGASARSCGAVLMLDLDHFKTINETRGHEAGDRLLREAVRRLRTCLAPGDALARHGGDEFVVVLAGLGTTAQEAISQAEAVGQKILAEVRKPVFGKGVEPLYTSLSVGVSVFGGGGREAETVDELLKRCELAMYQAKSDGRNMLRFYDPQMQAAVAARAALESDMRAGLEAGQFELHYQPKVAHEKINGCEALVRWRHPIKGFVAPGQFIPLAEDSGLILPLGTWVLRTACAQLARWSTDPVLGALTVAVNVSPRQFHEPRFVAQVLEALAGSGAEPARLRLELTESMLLHDVDETIAKMEQLRSYGVRFSLDDFGTGYSSLAYLKRLPLYELKIDQSFVRDVLTDPNDAAIARTIIALGSSLGLQVTAEGVETEAQRDFLQRHGCHHWQGYLLSRPLPATQYEALVHAQNNA